MKFAESFFYPMLLIALSFVLFGCQPDETPEAASADEISSGQEQSQREVSISINQITHITWQWVELIENKPTAQSIVPDAGNYTISFWEDGTFSYKADCNAGNGTYTIDGNTVEFGLMMTRLAMCLPESLHDQYLTLLGEIDTVSMTDDKLTLTLKNEAGEMHFVNGGAAEKPKSTNESFEPEIRTLYVGPEKVDCMGVAPMKCYQVTEDPDGEWQLFYDQIDGFEWESGYTYELRIVVRQVENPPADASSLRYELIEVVNMVETPIEFDKSAQYIHIEQPSADAELDTSRPIIVSGMGGALFEGTVVVRVLNAAGNELSLQSTIIQSPEAGIGGEGPWEVELPVTVDAPSSGKIIASATSPKDGSIVASDEIDVTFNPGMTLTSSLENTPWQLVGLTDGTLNSALAVHQVTALFVPTEGQIRGLSGCNRYFASYGLESGQLTIPGPIGATRMMCPEPQMAIEKTYLAALERVNDYEITPHKTLNLLDNHGNPILVFQVEPYSTTDSFTHQELANTSYLNEFSETGAVLLVDGIYNEPITTDSATKLGVMLTNFAAFGDLDGDGQEEAVIILISNPGGSGTFYDLAVVRKQGEALINPDSLQLGDRVQIKNIHVKNSEILLEMLTQGPDDPMCCPTQQVINVYTLKSGRLVQVSSEIIE